MLQDPEEHNKKRRSDRCNDFTVDVLHCGHLTFWTKADLMPTENSLSPPPKYPTGPAYIPLSNDSEKRRRRI